MQTIEEAKKFLRDNLDKGETCPCCTQFVKMYKRKLTSSMAYGLFLLYKYSLDYPQKYVHVEDYFKSLKIPSSIRGDISKLIYWGLIERQQGERKDGSNRLGYYRITSKGISYVKGDISVPGHVKIYNNKFYGYTNDSILFEEAVGNKFKFNELMS